MLRCSRTDIATAAKCLQRSRIIRERWMSSSLKDKPGRVTPTEEEEEAFRYDAPWETLVGYPSRVSWRHLPPHENPKIVLEKQMELLKEGERTGRQLRRTFRQLQTAHTSLAEGRERERRNMVNFRGRDKKARGTPSSGGLLNETPKSVAYTPEYTFVQLKYRLLPNYAICRRVLQETSSLLDGRFSPTRIIDYGMGTGASTVAALDLFGADVEWIHGIEPSRSMRDAADQLLTHTLESGKRSAPSKKKPRTRITMSESLTSSSQEVVSREDTEQKREGVHRRGGTFDLALMNYTALELPQVASGLAAAAMLWEKLRHNGVLIVIEPGTPDGFGSIRAIRNMLIDCGTTDTEECQVIAPCTHNGTCPMERHQKDFFKTKKASDTNEEEENNDDDDQDEFMDLDDEPSLEDAYKPFLAELKNHPDWMDDDDDDDDDDLFVEKGKQASPKEKQEQNPNKDTLDTTDVFNRSFCSFVHTLSGSDRRGKGEKFSYVVLQKRIMGHDTDADKEKEHNPFAHINIVDLLADSVEASRITGKGKSAREMRDADRHASLLQTARDVEDQFLESNADRLGLELVKGDDHRSSWGRIIRAPIKRKGHIIMDYCCAPTTPATMSVSETDEDGDLPQLEGKIVRQKISRGWSARVAPGAYAAARKARWGGLWPDISDRVNTNNTEEPSNTNPKSDHDTEKE
eukprot:scaffold331115_cov56-Attheya_sp.AAC.3